MATQVYPVVSHPSITGSSLATWSPPAPGFVKYCNVDASIFHHAESIGSGFIIRNDRGEVDKRAYGLKDPFVAEALGCREALSWLKNAGLQRVVVESDCLLLVQAVNSHEENSSYAGLIVEDYRLLLKSLLSLLLTLTKGCIFLYVIFYELLVKKEGD